VELEEELRVVGNNLKSLEVSEEKVFNLKFRNYVNLGESYVILGMDKLGQST